MVDSTLTMSTSPLVDLVQAIHLPSHRFLLTTSANPDSGSIIDLHLFAPTPAGDSRDSGNDHNGVNSRISSPSSTSSKSGARSIITWQGQIDLDDGEVDQIVLADAIRKGYLHVDMPMTYKKELSKAETLDLKILPPESDPCTFRLTTSEVSAAVPHLLAASFELLARPAIPTDKTEIRSLRSQIAQRDAEIASLSVKLSSAKATVVRATASDNSKVKKLLSPVKKAPANASALQPNAKRRRVVEDDFAGSDEE